MLALSATIDQLDLFEWYIFRGVKGKPLVSQKTKTTLRSGDVYGIREVRGGKYHLILPDFYRVNFVLEEREVNSLLQRSNKKRKAPDVQPTKATNVVKTPAGKILMAKNLDPRFRVFDAPYFKAARHVNNEMQEGINFANYQWRRHTEQKPLILKKTGKLYHTVYKGDIFGVRYIKPAVGGIFVDQMGHRFTVDSDTWESMLNSSTVLPKNRWPEGNLSPDQVKAALTEAKQALRNERRGIKEVMRLSEKKRKAEEAKKAEEKRKEIAAKRREERDRAKQAAEELKQARKSDLLRGGTKSKVIPMSDTEMADFLVKQAEQEKAKLRKHIPEVVDYEDSDLTDDIESEIPQGSDKLNFDPDEDSIAEDSTDPVPLLADIVAEKRKNASKVNLKDLEDEDDSDEEEPELDEDDIEYEDEEEEDGPDEPDVSPEEEDEALAEAEIDEEETAAVDELEEPEEKEVEDYVAEEGDVVTFNSDTEDQAEYALLSISPLKGSGNIMVYKVYDLSSEPETYKNVRIDTKSKRTFGSMVQFVRKLESKEFQELLDLTEDYKLDKSPIVS